MRQVLSISMTTWNLTLRDSLTQLTRVELHTNLQFGSSKGILHEPV